VTASTRVFVSYRREDSRHVAARLAERLEDHFKLYMDIDLVQPGMDFPSVVRKAIGQSDVLVAVIGPHWLSATDASGHRRLDDPDDWVVTEISNALHRKIPLIPVLVDGARMPTHDELPPRLTELSNRQALIVAYESFAADSARLVSVVETLSRTRQEESLFSDEDYRTAVTAYFEEQWPSVIEHLERVLSRYPAQPHVTERLTHARLMNRLDELDKASIVAADQGRWRDAVNALEQLTDQDPEFHNARDRLEPTRKRLRISELQAYIHTLAAAGQWTAVVDADAELAKLDRSAANPDGLANRARAELAEADLAAKYAAGLQALNQGDWQGALDHFSALLGKRPGYRDTDQLVSKARARLTPPRAEVPAFAPPRFAMSGQMPTGPPPTASFATTREPPGRKRAGRKILLVVGIGVVLVLIAISVLSLSNLGGGRPKEAAVPGPNTVPATIVTPSDTAWPITPSSDPSETDSPAEKLRNQLPAAFSEKCNQYEPISEIKSGLVVALTCQMGAGEPDGAAYHQYKTKAAMTEAFRTLAGPAPTDSGSCKKGEDYRGRWSQDGNDRGSIHCFSDSKTKTRYIIWTHEDLKIVSMAWTEKLSPAKFYDWWLCCSGPE
jgi:tetratricopeptide (TPR) repeat protein